MDLGTLRYTGAGRSLGLSQGTVSAAVQGLERELGTRLLDRTRTGVTPTVTGRELSQRALEMLAFHDETVDRVRELEGADTGEFVVAVAEELATWLAPVLLQTLVAALPGITLTVRVVRAPEVARAVQSREAHFAFAVEPERLPDLVLVTVGRDRARLFASEVLARRRGFGRSGSQPSAGPPGGSGPGRAPAGSLLAALPAVPLDGSVLVACAEQDPFALRWLEDAAAAGLRVRLLHVGSVDVVRRVVGLGVASGLLPGGQRTLHAGLVELPVDLDPAPLSLSLVFRADVHRTRAAVRLKDHLIALGREACGSPVG